MKKLFAITTILLLLVPLLSACQIGAPQYECEDEFGCVQVCGDDPIRIAFSFVISGPDASLGTDTQRGVEMAAEERGELMGHSIEVVGEDSLCTAEGGQAAAQKLAADESIVAVIGTNCSSAARAAVPVLCGANIPTISPSNTAPDLTDPGRPADYNCYLRTAHNDLVQGAAAAQFASEYLGVTKVATIHDGSIYADQLQQVMADTFQSEYGGEVTAQEATEPTATEMGSMLTRIAATEPELIYYPIFIAAGGQITSQARTTPGLEEIYLMGADGMFSPDFWEAAGDAATGMYHSSPDFAAFGSGYQEFLQRHEAKYGGATLAPFHAHAYDASNMVFAAIEEVGVQEGDCLYIGRKALRDALYATENFQGLTGSLTCDEYGDCADPKIAVYESFNPDPANWNPGAGAENDPRKVWP
jgi:branched-chain amino acid transport system substrate-binding protein